jgi:hypothetical protein
MVSGVLAEGVGYRLARERPVLQAFCRHESAQGLAQGLAPVFWRSRLRARPVQAVNPPG